MFRHSRTTPSQRLTMSLSVSSFPEAPPKLVRQPKWQVTPSLKSSGRFLGTLLSKRSVPFLKGIGHFAKTHVKESIIRQRANVSRSRSIFKHRSRSSIQSSSIVIDITPISNNDKYFSARSSDVDASSLNPTIEISLSPTISPAALSTPTLTAAQDIPAISPRDPVKSPYQSSVQSLNGDGAHTHETVIQHPAKEHEEITSADSEPHDPQTPDSEMTTSLPISTSPTTQPLTIIPVPSTEGRRRSSSASAGVNASTTEIPRTRPRYKSETAIGLRRLTSMTSCSEGRDTSGGENPIPQPPATGSSTHTFESTSTKKQRQQRRETTSKRARARSSASSKSTGSNKAVELPPLTAHMLSMRSAGSRLSASSHRSCTAPPPQSFSLSATAIVPKSSLEQMDPLQTSPHLPTRTSDVAVSLRSRSTLELVVGPGPSDGALEQSLPPSSVDRGRWLRLAAVPHAESWDGERQRRRPRTAPEAVLMAGW